VVGSVNLQAGDDFIHGFIYEYGSLWASTRTAPCRILRIDPETLHYERIILQDDFNEGEDLVAAEGYIWVILYGPPSRIVRIDPDTLRWEAALTFPPEEFARGGSLAFAFGYLWAGGGDGRIARIDPADQGYEVFDFSTALGRLQVHALTGGDDVLWAGAPLFRNSETRPDESIILRISPEHPLEYAAVFLHDAPVGDDMAHLGGRLYTGGETDSSTVYTINHDLTYTSQNLKIPEALAFVAADDRIWGALGGSPGSLIRFDGDMRSIDTYLLPEGYNNANEIAIDPVGGHIFVTCWDSPAKILKFRFGEIPSHRIASSIP
jgi:streptogramin lyase